MDRRLIAILGLFLTAAAITTARAQDRVQGQVPVRPGAGQQPAPKLPAPGDEPPELPPPADLPRPANGAIVVSPGDPNAPRDDDLTRVADGSAPGLSDPYVLPVDGLPVGPQSVSLTVEVQSDQVAYLNKVMDAKIFVKNTGKTDARGVVVRDLLPEGVEFVEGVAPQVPERSGQMLTWTLNNLPAGTEKVLKIKVKATRVGPIDHAATVSLKTASRSRTVVQQPKLRIEQIATSTKVLKGQPAQFKVTVSNPGTGTARNVLVQARISGGLRHEQNSRSLDLPIKEIRPNETLPPIPLTLDTAAGGPQFCEVIVSSPDVVPGSKEEEAAQVARVEIEVTEPLLSLAITGPDKSYTRKTSLYHLVVENPGTAPVQNVGVAVYIPEGGELTGKPTGSRYTANDRNLRMTIPRIEPKEKAEFDFRVQFGGVQLFKLSAMAKVATNDRPLSANSQFATDVQGMAEVRVSASERGGILDVGEIAEFEIRLRNIGTKDANQVLVSVELTPNLKIEETDHDGEEQAKYDRNSGKLIFPPIARFAPGAEQRFVIKASTTATGRATCRVAVLFDNETEPIQAIANSRVEALSTPRR